jgi:hypothetical protein
LCHVRTTHSIGFPGWQPLQPILNVNAAATSIAKRMAFWVSSQCFSISFRALACGRASLFAFGSIVAMLAFQILSTSSYLESFDSKTMPCVNCLHYRRNHCVDDSFDSINVGVYVPYLLSIRTVRCVTHFPDLLQKNSQETEHSSATAGNQSSPKILLPSTTAEKKTNSFYAFKQDECRRSPGNRQGHD